MVTRVRSTASSSKLVSRTVAPDRVFNRFLSSPHTTYKTSDKKLLKIMDIDRCLHNIFKPLQLLKLQKNCISEAGNAHQRRRDPHEHPHEANQLFWPPIYNIYTHYILYIRNEMSYIVKLLGSEIWPGCKEGAKELNSKRRERTANTM